MKVPFYKHSLNEQDKENVMSVLDSTFLTTGPKTEAFESKFAKFLSVSHVVGATSWTNAAFLVLKAWGVGRGAEVIVPAQTFIASANVVEHCGAQPVFCDVDPRTGNLDIEKLKSLINERTVAVMPVHLYGVMVDVLAIKEICAPKGIKILEDAAHCVEGSRQGYRPATHSDAACFSFYATKNLTCGEGGAIACQDSRLADQLKQLRLHGMSKGAHARYQGNYQHWDMVSLGYKANMFDIQAALLLNQLDRLEENRLKREKIYRYYAKRFTPLGIEFPQIPQLADSAFHLFTLWAPVGTRDQFLEKLQAAGIGVAVNFRAVPTLQYYRDKYGFQSGQFPIAEQIGERTLSIPFYPHLTDQEMEHVADTVEAIHAGLTSKKVA